MLERCFFGYVVMWVEKGGTEEERIRKFRGTARKGHDKGEPCSTRLIKVNIISTKLPYLHHIYNPKTQPHPIINKTSNC